MSEPELVTVYDSQGNTYERSFQVFLNHTDQKVKAREWLSRRVQSLPSRRVFVDAGAGNGKVTAWLLDQFQRTVAIEPNPYLRGELRRACPAAEVLPAMILDAALASQGSLVLCSHVFYYIERAAWVSHLEKLASWLAPDGVLIVVLQNPATDCMRMVRHFLGARFDLSELAARFQAHCGDRYEATLETVPARVATPDFATAYTVAEFMLNLLPMPQPPPRAALEEYIRRELVVAEGGYRFSCDQDFLQIRPRQAPDA